MKNIFNILFLLVLLVGCKNTNKPVVTIVANPVLINAGLETRLPGNLILTGNYLVWFDPFSIDNFIKIVDPATGKQIGQTGTTGQGPQEFSTPSVSILQGNKILITDLNSDKQAILSIDDLLKGNVAYTFGKNTNFREATAITETDRNQYVALFPNEQKPFRLIENSQSTPFGAYPVKDPISNGYDIFQGVVCYNPSKRLLVYSIYSYPYIAVYKNTGSKFQLKKEITLYKPDYQISNNEMKIQNATSLITGLTLTKDYIVAAQKHEYKDTSENGRDGKNLPQTLYVYDYELNLLKIIDMQTSVLRLAGNESSNTIYAITIAEQFDIVKIEL